MKSRKLLNIILIAAIVISQFNFLSWDMRAHAATDNQTGATKYFYKQLTKDAKVFYEAMETMMAAGFFKKGNASMEVLGLSPNKITAFKNGSQELLNDMGAGRDAFMLDYPELFYVDFDYLSMRVTEDSGVTHVCLGTGRGDNYINKEFLTTNGEVDETKINDSITTVNKRIKEIVDKAQTKKTIREKVEVAHDEVIKAAEYTLEYKTDYPYTVRTIYGVFGLGNTRNDGNAVCEGYARALKTILDRLGIPALLVRGAYMDNGYQQEHMWVYVQIDGEWYGVDPTFDNGLKSEDTTGTISYEYFLVDGVKMSEHIPYGVISTSNFEFDYPVLNGGVTEDNNDYSKVDPSKIVYKDANGLLIVDAGKEKINGKEVERVFHISYNGKGYKKAAEEDGVYIITNSWQDKPNWGTDEVDTYYTDWLYPSEIDSYANIYKDYDNYLSMRADNITGFNVGLTTVPKGPETEENYYGVYYEGTDSEIFAKSADIASGKGQIEYAQPFMVKTTPSQQLAQTVGKTYHVTIEYDQDLIFDKENTDKKIGYELKIYDHIYGWRDPDPEYLQYDITEPVLVDNRTIAFDITPSRLWTMDKVEYIVQFTGVYGTLSHKEPFPVVYGFTNNNTGCIYALRAMGVDMESYSKPVLMDDFELEDILPEDYFGEGSDVLQKYGDLLKNRLSLMVTNTSDEAQEKKMENALLEELGSTSLDNTTGKTNVEMYNISLSLCTEQLKKLKDGTKLKVMLAFPLGYTYKDFAGDNDGSSTVTFKAYHYNIQENGTYAIEEIECIVTELGLIIYVDSFSPFAIAAVKSTGNTVANTDKTIRLNVTEGGKVTTNNVAIDEEEEEEEQIVNIVHNYDYKYLDDGTSEKVYDVKDGRTFTITADAGFVIEKVEKIKNVQKGANGTTYETEKIDLTDGKTFKVEYRNIEGSEVTYNVIFVAEDTGTIKEAPKTFTASVDATKGSNAIDTLKTGDTFNVTFSLESTDGNFNISSIGGVVDYNSNLKLKSVVSASAGKWYIKYYDTSNKFIATVDSVNSKSAVFIATFEVVGPTGTASINISDLKAGTGGLATIEESPIAIASPLSLSFDIEGGLLELNNDAASANITIKGAYVIIPVGMTKAEFIEYVTSPSEPTITLNPIPNQNQKSELSEDIIKTGDTLSVGESVWTFSVRGDLDGNGVIDVNDLSIIKEHYIGKRVLTGAYLEAAETDGDNDPASVNDISRLKLAIIGKIEDLFSDLDAE